MKIYIAGKVTGMEEEAKVLFDEAERKLSAQIACTIVNPLKLNHNHDKSWESYMKVCIAELVQCDAIFLMKNWNRDSKGAALELHNAKALKLLVMYEDEYTTFHIDNDGNVAIKNMTIFGNYDYPKYY